MYRIDEPNLACELKSWNCVGYRHDAVAILGDFQNEQNHLFQNYICLVN